MVVAQGSDGTRRQSSDSLVPFPPSWKPKEEGAGKGIGLGNEYIGQDTCVCKRQNPIQIYLGKKEKKTEVLLEQVTEKFRIGLALTVLNSGTR